MRSDWKYSPGSSATRSAGGIRTSAPRSNSGIVHGIDASELEDQSALMIPDALDFEFFAVSEQPYRLQLDESSGMAGLRDCGISPRTPRGRTSTATVTQSAGALLKDFQRVAPVGFHAGRTENGADGTRRSALFADHFAQISGGHFQPITVTAHHPPWSRPLLRHIDQRFGDIFNELFHRRPPFSRPFWERD